MCLRISSTFTVRPGGVLLGGNAAYIEVLPRRRAFFVPCSVIIGLVFGLIFGVVLGVVFLGVAFVFGLVVDLVVDPAFNWSCALCRSENGFRRLLPG